MADFLNYVNANGWNIIVVVGIVAYVVFLFRIAKPGSLRITRGSSDGLRGSLRITRGSSDGLRGSLRTTRGSSDGLRGSLRTDEEKKKD